MVLLGTIHPLEGDGVCSCLFDQLSKENKRLMSAGVWIPSTVLFEQGFAKAWYYSERITRNENGKKKKYVEVKKRIGKDCNIESIRTAMTKDTREGEICATFLSVGPNRDLTRPSEKSEVAYMDSAMLCEFLNGQVQKPKGLLQKFVRPKGQSNTVILTTWSPSFLVTEARRNRHSLYDRHVNIYKRATTFEGSSNTCMPVVVGPVVKNLVREASKALVDHFLSTDHLSIARMVLYFKVDHENILRLLFSSSIRIKEPKTHTREGTTPLNLCVALVAKAATESSSALHKIPQTGDDHELDQLVESATKAEKLLRRTRLCGSTKQKLSKQKHKHNDALQLSSNIVKDTSPVSDRIEKVDLQEDQNRESESELKPNNNNKNDDQNFKREKSQMNLRGGTPVKDVKTGSHRQDDWTAWLKTQQVPTETIQSHPESLIQSNRVRSSAAVTPTKSEMGSLKPIRNYTPQQVINPVVSSLIPSPIKNGKPCRVTILSDECQTFSPRPVGEGSPPPPETAAQYFYTRAGMNDIYQSTQKRTFDLPRSGHTNRTRKLSEEERRERELARKQKATFLEQHRQERIPSVQQNVGTNSVLLTHPVLSRLSTKPSYLGKGKRPVTASQSVGSAHHFLPTFEAGCSDDSSKPVEPTATSHFRNASSAGKVRQLSISIATPPPAVKSRTSSQNHDIPVVLVKQHANKPKKIIEREEVIPRKQQHISTKPTVTPELVRRNKDDQAKVEVKSIESPRQSHNDDAATRESHIPAACCNVVLETERVMCTSDSAGGSGSQFNSVPRVSSLDTPGRTKYGRRQVKNYNLDSEEPHIQQLFNTEVAKLSLQMEEYFVELCYRIYSFFITKGADSPFGVDKRVAGFYLEEPIGIPALSIDVIQVTLKRLRGEIVNAALYCLGGSQPTMESDGDDESSQLLPWPISSNKGVSITGNKIKKKIDPAMTQVRLDQFRELTERNVRQTREIHLSSLRTAAVDILSPPDNIELSWDGQSLICDRRALVIFFAETKRHIVKGGMCEAAEYISSILKKPNGYLLGIAQDYVYQKHISPLLDANPIADENISRGNSPNQLVSEVIQSQPLGDISEGNPTSVVTTTVESDQLTEQPGFICNRCNICRMCCLCRYRGNTKIDS